MKPFPLAATVLVVTGASFCAGQLFPLKNLPYPSRELAAAGGSDPTEFAYRKFQQILAEFEADELFGASSERILQVPVAQSQRPMFFQNRIVPSAAVTLYEENAQLKQAGALIADMSPEAEKIDYWIAKAGPSKFWERRAASITGWPTLPATSASPSDTPADLAPEVADHETTQPPATSPALLQELTAADAEFVKVGAETPGKLAVLPSPPLPESLRPVIFRDRIVPRAAQTLYENNEQLKRLQSPRADYSPAAEEPVFWVPQVASSVFWNHRMATPTYQAQFSAAKSKAATGSTAKSVSPRPGAEPKQLAGMTGYMTKADVDLGKAFPLPNSAVRKVAEDAMAKLAKLAQERGVLEQEGRSAMDRRTALEGEYLKAKEQEIALNADQAANQAGRQRHSTLVREWLRDSRAAGGRERLDSNLIDWPPGEDFSDFARRRDELNSMLKDLGQQEKELDTRQEVLTEKLVKIANEKKDLEAKGPALTANITAIIKEQIEVQAMMFGNKR